MSFLLLITNTSMYVWLLKFQSPFKVQVRDAWVAQLAKCLILDFGSGHDLRVKKSSPALDSTLDVEPA